MDPKGWQQVLLGDVLTFHRGFDITKDQQRPGPYSVISSSGPNSTHAEFMAKGPGVIIGRKGSLGTVFYSERDYWPHDTTLYVRDFHGNLPRFAYYFLQTLGLERYDAGASNPSLNRNHIHRLPVLWPIRNVQHEIVKILSAYDHLIENNLRRIRVLEEMTRAIYREWFIRNGTSGAGIMSNSWSTTPLGELCHSIDDGDWIEAKDQGGCDYRLVQISNIGVGEFIETDKFRYVTQETFDRLGCNEVRAGDILIARMPTPIGRGWLVSEMPWRMVTAVDVAIVRVDVDRLDPNYFITYWNEQETLERLAKQASGTTRPRVTRREIASFEVPVPPIELQRRFGTIAAEHLALAGCLRGLSVNLRATHDLLLPRLMSGRLSLAQAEAAAS
jgi:type I restriction enzyme, S subunit